MSSWSRDAKQPTAMQIPAVNILFMFMSHSNFNVNKINIKLSVSCVQVCSVFSPPARQIRCHFKQANCGLW